MKAKSKRGPGKAGFVAIAILLLATAGCGQKGGKRTVAPVPVNISIERLDQDLFRSASSTGGNFSMGLFAKYGEFYRIYVEDVLQAAPYNDPRLPLALIQFTHDPDWAAVQELADSVLGDLAPQQAGFNAAFGRLKAFFPDSLVPRIVAYNSGFNYGVLPTDSVLGFGVEWFVGQQSPVVKYLSPEIFPQYRKERMRPELLLPSVVKGWLLAHYTRDTRGEDLLNNLVSVGKTMALLDALLPDVPAPLKFGFTAEQLKWCQEQEFNIWREIVAKEMLYSTDAKVVGRFMDDGPFTPGLPRESPGNIGAWIGYRMVESYLKANPGVDFAELLAMHDPQAILKTYKPR